MLLSCVVRTFLAADGAWRWSTAKGGRSQAGTISFGQFLGSIFWSVQCAGWHPQQSWSPHAAQVTSFGEESPSFVVC